MEIKYQKQNISSYKMVIPTWYEHATTYKNKLNIPLQNGN